jgi:hypothetical protein
MEQIEFPQDFSEFLKLLNAHHVEALCCSSIVIVFGGLLHIL